MRIIQPASLVWIFHENALASATPSPKERTWVSERTTIKWSKHLTFRRLPAAGCRELQLLAATTDMGVLPGVLGCRLLRRTVPGTPRNQHPAVARWHTHLRGLATAIHEISGLKRQAGLSSFLSPEHPSRVFLRTTNLSFSLAAPGRARFLLIFFVVFFISLV